MRSRRGAGRLLRAGLLGLAITAWMAVPVPAKGPSDCPWVVADGAFRGSALEQALCLLAGPDSGASVLSALPATFDALVGTPCAIAPDRMERFMGFVGVSAEDVGGPGFLRTSLSAGKPAEYFVLHGDRVGATGCHVRVRADGSSETMHDFFSPLVATQFERKDGGVLARGRFLHVSVAAPSPGRPDCSDCADRAAQYRRLALVYLVASRRAGRWLIPVDAGVLDRGYRGGASGPAEFSLEAWGTAVRAAYRELLSVQ